MESDSTAKGKVSPKVEIGLFLERFAQLTLGSSVLLHGSVIEEETVPRSSDQLLSALRMVDTIFDYIDLDRIEAARSQVRFENIKSEYEWKIDQERRIIADLQCRLDRQLEENNVLRANLMSKEAIARS